MGVRELLTSLQKEQVHCLGDWVGQGSNSKDSREQMARARKKPRRKENRRCEDKGGGQGEWGKA